MDKSFASMFVLGTGSLAMGAAAQVNVVMTGLDNPRGLALGPDGGVYVAEAGRGGTGTAIVNGEGVSVQFGATGAVSRLLNGTQARVITGLPSLASQAGATPGGRAGGLTDIAFSGADLYGVIGLAANPAVRATLAADSGNFAHLVKLPLGGARQNIADIGAFEGTNNPDGGAVPDTNPFGLRVTATGFAVADAGANALFTVTAGVVATRAVFPALPNLPGPPPVYQAVPTTVTNGPDGAFYVGQLTGFPFTKGAANVFRVDPATGAQTVFADNFTTIIDLAFASDGDLLVLQITSNGIAAQPPGAGQLIRVDSVTGVRTTLLSDPLFFPGGLVVAPDGSFYVSNFGTSAGGGQVLHLVPEPGTLGVLAAGLMTWMLPRRRARRGRGV
jgi:hypothetical protein